MSQSLGKYELVAEIARGGMGIVYLAVAHGPARFSKLLVIKELKPELVEDGNFLEMFLEEARLAARLNHPNIVQTYEIGDEGNRHYMVMDYLEGMTLARILRKNSDRFTLPMQLRILCEVLQGLQYAHTLADFDGTPLGIVHRDATPQNVFVTYDGQVKLVDFGIAKALDSTVETRTGVLKGKPAYMSPEQVAGDVDPRADVYAVGVMLWEAIVGRRMWHKRGDVEVLTAVIKGQLPSLREAKPDVDDALAAIVDKALAKDRDQRYANARELGEAIDGYMADKGITVSMREVGRVVGELFEADRERVRAAVESHLHSLRTGAPRDEKLPSIHPPSLDGGTPSGASGRRRSDGSSLATGPSSGTQPTPAGTEVPGTIEVTFASSSPEAVRSKTRRRAIVAIGAVIALLLLALVFGALRSKPEAKPKEATAEPSASAPPVAAGTAAPATATTTATHAIEVKVTPPSATVAFNGVTYANPAKTTCRQGEELLLRANANGYAARERTVTCSSDESIELVLAPLPPAWTPPPSRPAAPPPAPAPAPVAPATHDAPAAAAPAAKPDCNPPFYFQGTKKVFKPGCL